MVPRPKGNSQLCFALISPRTRAGLRKLSAKARTENGVEGFGIVDDEEAVCAAGLASLGIGRIVRILGEASRCIEREEFQDADHRCIGSCALNWRDVGTASQIFPTMLQDSSETFTSAIM